MRFPICAVGLGMMFTALGICDADADVSRLPPEGVPPLLQSAIDKLAQNQNSWAYTQTVTAMVAGKPRGETRVRFDPSKPYEEQYTPLLINGATPKPEDLERYRREGENRARRLDHDRERTGEERADEARIYVNGQTAVPDFAHAEKVLEDDRSATYELPLAPTNPKMNKLFGNLQLVVRVNKERGEFEHATMQLKKPLRMKIVAKLSRFLTEVEFIRVAPEYPPVIAAIRENVNYSVFFSKKQVTAEMRRSDFARVVPYESRFGVKIGPVRTLEF